MKSFYILPLILLAFWWAMPPLQAQDPCDTAPVFVSGPTLVCNGSTSTYSVIEEPGVDAYIWSIGNVVYPPTSESFIELEWTGPANYQLCVEAVCLGSQTSPLGCIQIEVYEVQGVDPPPIFVCSPDTFIGGNPPGKYEINLPTPDGCDSVITLTIAVFPEGPVDLGEIYLCEGDHWELNGKSYSDTGFYTVDGSLPFPPWCLREMTFQINAMDDAPISIHAHYPKGKKGNPELRPVGIPSGLNEEYFWTGPNGFASSTKNIIAPDEGLYCLELTFSFISDQSQSCTFQLCYDTSPPLPPDTNDDPGPFDPDGKEGMKPWLYPQPATDQLCIAWPGTDLSGNSFQIFNVWGNVMQSGSFINGCTDLGPLSPGVYFIQILFSTGDTFQTSILIKE